MPGCRPCQRDAAADCRPLRAETDCGDALDRCGSRGHTRQATTQHSTCSHRSEVLVSAAHTRGCLLLTAEPSIGMSLARAAAAAAQWGRQGRTGGCGACPAGREGPARAPGGERGDRLRRPRSHAGLPSLWASQQQRGFAIVTDTSDDTHDDFKPKYKGPPVDDAEETIKKDISSHQVFLYMKARGLCVCGGGGGYCMQQGTAREDLAKPAAPPVGVVFCGRLGRGACSTGSQAAAGHEQQRGWRGGRACCRRGLTARTVCPSFRACPRLLSAGSATWLCASWRLTVGARRSTVL